MVSTSGVALASGGASVGIGGSSVAVASGGSGRVGIAVNVPLTSVASAFESRVAGEPIV